MSSLFNFGHPQQQHWRGALGLQLKTNLSHLVKRIIGLTNWGFVSISSITFFRIEIVEKKKMKKLSSRACVPLSNPRFNSKCGVLLCERIPTTPPCSMLPHQSYVGCAPSLKIPAKPVLVFLSYCLLQRILPFGIANLSSAICTTFFRLNNGVMRFMRILLSPRTRSK